MKVKINQLITQNDYLKFEQGIVDEIKEKVLKTTEIDIEGIISNSISETIKSLKSFLIQRIRGKKINLEELFEEVRMKTINSLIKDKIITKKEQDTAEIVVYRSLKNAIDYINGINKINLKEIKNEASKT